MLSFLVRGILILCSAGGEIGKKITWNEHKPSIKILKISSLIEQTLAVYWSLFMMLWDVVFL
jgi:hypothetical protein